LVVKKGKGFLGKAAWGVGTRASWTTRVRRAKKALRAAAKRSIPLTKERLYAL